MPWLLSVVAAAAMGFPPDAPATSWPGPALSAPGELSAPAAAYAPARSPARASVYEMPLTAAATPGLGPAAGAPREWPTPIASYDDSPTQPADAGRSPNAALAPPPGEPLAPAESPAPVTIEQVQAQLKKSAWTKGAFKITPYGTLWASAAYETQRSRITDYCLFIDSPVTGNHPAFAVDAKSTRLGADVAGPPIPYLDGKLGGKVEIDFQGIFLTRNKPDVLLRHAYAEVKNDDYRLLAGQTWDVISPLGMPILNYTAGSAVGNLAYRRAQFRGERFFAFSETGMLTVQGALAPQILVDFPSDPLIHVDQGPYPDFQGRLAYTLGERKGPDARPIVIGVSAHIGQETVDFLRPLPNARDDVPERTWSFNVDVYIPITKQCGFQGEFFTGENLSSYFGGILQGVDRVTHRTIRANGGWGALWFDPLPELHTNTGMAIDDPLDQDLTNGRTFNQMLFTNVVYDLTKLWNVGFEVSYWKTGYLHAPRGESLRLELATKYRF